MDLSQELPIVVRGRRQKAIIPRRITEMHAMSKLLYKQDGVLLCMYIVYSVFVYYTPSLCVLVCLGLAYGRLQHEPIQAHIPLSLPMI